MIIHTYTVINIALCASNPTVIVRMKTNEYRPRYVLWNHGLVAVMRQTDQMKTEKPNDFIRFVNEVQLKISEYHQVKWDFSTS